MRRRHSIRYGTAALVAGASLMSVSQVLVKADTMPQNFTGNQVGFIVILAAVGAIVFAVGVMTFLFVLASKQR